MTVAPLFGQAYPPDRLVPLRIELQNMGAATIDGVVLVLAARPPAATTFRIPVQVPPNARVTLTAYSNLPAPPLAQASGAGTGTGVVPVALAEWRDADDKSKVIQVELYDHQSDPNETRNIAKAHPRLVEELTARLHARVPILRRP